MAGLQEYDLEIKLVHMIKEHGIYILAVEAVHAPKNEEELVGWENQIELYDIRRETPKENRTSWYTNVCQYLEHGTIPSHFSIRQKRALRLKALAYQSVHGVLYRKHSNGVFLRCLEAQELEKVLQDLHDRLVEGHFAGNNIAHKVMRASFYWPILFKYVHAYVRKFSVFQ